MEVSMDTVVRASVPVLTPSSQAALPAQRSGQVGRVRHSPLEEHYVFAVTRRTLHAIGETVLAGPQHRLTGTIRLYAAPGGFRTGPLGSPERFIAVRGIDLVVADGVIYANNTLDITPQILTALTAHPGKAAAPPVPR